MGVVLETAMGSVLSVKAIGKIKSSSSSLLLLFLLLWKAMSLVLEMVMGVVLEMGMCSVLSVKAVDRIKSFSSFCCCCRRRWDWGWRQQ